MKMQLLATIIMGTVLAAMLGCVPESGKKPTTEGDDKVVTTESQVRLTESAEKKSGVIDDNAAAAVEPADQAGEAVADAADETAKKTVKEQDAEATEMMNVGTAEADETASSGGAGSFAPTINESEELMLNSIILARGVDKREPVDAGTQFSVTEGEKIYAILDVKNMTEEDATLYVSWKMPGSDKEIGKTDLTAKPAKNWRTWSFTRWAKKAGTWEAIVRNADEEIIARAPFEVIE